jgi:predicted DNA-binding transcriptional regulator AlpA
LGFGGTVRQIRNLNRRVQAPFSGMDQTIFWGGCLVLSEHEEFCADMETLFKERIERVLSNQSVVEAEQKYNAIMARHDLLSVRDRDARLLAIEVLGSVLTNAPDYFSFTNADRRLFIKIYGQVLDTPFADIIVALITSGGMADVRHMFLKSIKESTEVYRHVLASAVQRRITAMNRSERTDDKPDYTPMHSQQPVNKPANTLSLLSTSQVMEQLGVSRVTLYRLERAGHLVPIHIGRSKRYEQAEINRYLGRT